MKTGKGKIVNQILIFFLTISLFVSIAAGNIFLGILALCFFIQLYKKQISFNQDYKEYFIAIGLFIISMLLSTLFSGDIVYGLKRWADMWIWRFMPFVVVIFLLNNYIDAQKVMLTGFAGITLTSVYAVYQGLSGMSRANGFYGHPMTLGGWLCIFLPLLFGAQSGFNLFVGGVDGHQIRLPEVPVVVGVLLSVSG